MLKINVGLSRKVTEDYNSKGFSLNIEGELPSDVLYDEKALSQSTGRLFQLAHLMLDQQVEKASGAGSSQNICTRIENGHTNGHVNRFNDNGASSNQNQVDVKGGLTNSDSGGLRNGDRVLTQAQTRAIANMTRRLNLDPDRWVNEQFGCQPSQLTVKQASKAIDMLKT